MTYATENLELAQSLTAHRVEINQLETCEDEVSLSIGDYCSVFIERWSSQVCLDIPNRRFVFGNPAAAIQAADTYETVMDAISVAAKASREKVSA